MDWRMSDCFWRSQGLLIHPSNFGTTNSKETLIIYLTVHEKSIGYILGQHDETEKKEHTIYYLSKKFTEYESKYLLVEKMCCALAWTTQRLRQYLLYHTIWLISKLDPIKYIFEKPSLSGWIARWKSYCRNTTFSTYLKRRLKEAPLQNFWQTELKKSISQ